MSVAAPEAQWAPHTLLVQRLPNQHDLDVGGWVRQGLQRGEMIFYSTVDGDTAAVSQLQQGGVDVARAVRDGQLTFVSAERFFPGAEQATLVRRALDRGFPGVRLSAQADAALDHVGVERYQAIDHSMDELCAGLPVMALCQYDVRRTPSAAEAAGLITAIDSHLDAVRDGDLRLRRWADQVSLAGEADLASAPVLGRALRGICQSGPGSEIVLDMSALTFVDVAGCRALVAGTEPLRGRGGTVFLRGVDGHVHKVMALLGIDRLAGLELA